MRVLFATPELGPWVKSGGLGEVSHALPRALAAAGCEVRILVPRYPALAKAFPQALRIATVPSPGGAFAAAAIFEAAWDERLALWLIDCPSYYNRNGSAYHNERGDEHADNALRFGLLSRLAARLAGAASPLAWRPDVVHGNDWMCGLAPAYAHYRESDVAPFVLGLHNAAFQGVFPLAWAERLDLPPAARGVDGVEFHGQLSFLKAGLQFADRLVAVSARYAEEIQSEAFGYGLAGLLRWRKSVLTGIANGIDTETWNPRHDPLLAQCFDLARIEAKAANKAALQRELQLELAPHLPLIGMVSRLTWQKGIDLVADCTEKILGLPAQLAILGTGERALETRLGDLAGKHAGAMAVRIGFDEGLAHRIEAGADMFLMPSRFEPCGLNQMYSQRYGTPPIVHETGGLADTVTDCTPPALADGSATGFTFSPATTDAMLAALHRGVRLWHDRPTWRCVMTNGMRRDFGWGNAAGRYIELYQGMVTRRRKAK